MRTRTRTFACMAGAAALLALPALAQTQSGPPRETPAQETAPPGAQQNGRMGGQQSGQTGTMSQPESSAETSTSMDNKFIQKAAEGGMLEVELGRIAQEKAESQEVKDFGKRMVTDHSKANEELKEIASKQNITLPTSLSAKQQKQIDKLSKLSGPEFDKAYMKHMLKDHRKDVAEFQKEANRGQESDVKSFASSTLPTLQQHLEQAQQITETMKTTGTAARSKSNQTQPSTQDEPTQDKMHQEHQQTDQPQDR